MEPRELWERHAVLAQAFCSSDDEVRRTQGLLDEAEARRSRTLAAFAVTVGSDAVVADLLGLDEREVRLARRTVGKDDARAVAKSLLAQPAREQPPAGEPSPAREQAPAQPTAAHATGQAAAHPAAHATGQAAAPPTGQPAAGQPMAGQSMAGPSMAGQPMAGQSMPGQSMAGQSMGQAAAAGPAAAEPGWAPALDAVLMSSWHTGVDLTALATELGLDVRLLVARAQQLSAESRPAAQPAPSDRIGRHRRMATLQPSQQPESSHLTWRERPQQPPREQYEHDAWRQQPYQSHEHYPDYPAYQDYQVYGGQQPAQPAQPSHPAQSTWDANAITAAQHDWDGILSQWEATTSTPPPIPSPGHGGGA